jgi:hypothetical protein
MDDGTAPPLSLETVSLVASEATDPAAANGLDENVPLASGGIYVPDKTESLKGMAFNLANSTIGAGSSRGKLLSPFQKSLNRTAVKF